MARAGHGPSARRHRLQKGELDRLRIHAPGRATKFDHSQDLELTFTSNAIEGNALAAVETTMVIEHGVTIAGKPLKDHLEAIDHCGAIKYVREPARQTVSIGKMDIRSLHRLVMLRSDPDIAGRHANQGRFVLTDRGRRAFPSPNEVPVLRGKFSSWLGAAPDAPGTAAGGAGIGRAASISPARCSSGIVARVRRDWESNGLSATRLAPPGAGGGLIMEGCRMMQK